MISITDGQIFLEANLFYSGVRPAVDAGTSVSRVGGDAQIKAMKKVAGTLKLDLASYRELEAFSQFGSDLDKATKAKLDRGARTVEILKQNLHKPYPVEDQVIVLYALTQGFVDDVPIADVRRFESELLGFVKQNHPEILSRIRESGNLPDKKPFANAIDEFKKTFAPSKGN